MFYFTPNGSRGRHVPRPKSGFYNTSGERKANSPESSTLFLSLHNTTKRREVTVDELNKIARLFNVPIDLLVNNEGAIPAEVVLEDKSTVEQMQLIQQLDEEDKQTVFRIIDKMLTTKKIQGFFPKKCSCHVTK